MNNIKLCYLISLTVKEKLDMRLIDIMTVSMDTNINKNNTRNIYNINLQEPLYGLKQSICKWYNCF